MTIGVRTSGAWAAGSTTVTPALPDSPAAGDMMILFVATKPYNRTINEPTGWTRIGTQQTNGTTSSSADLGSVTWSVFYREWQSGDAAPTVSITNGNSSLGVIHGFTKTASAWITPTAYFGSDTSSGTDYAATMAGSSGNLAAGDYVIHNTVIAGNNATFDTPTLTATDATFGTVTEHPSTEGSTATGFDLGASAARATVNSGTASADAVVGWTLSVAQTGGSALVRLREDVTTVTGTSSDEITQTLSASGTVLISGTSTSAAIEQTLTAVGTVLISGTSTSDPIAQTLVAEGTVADAAPDVTGTSDLTITQTLTAVGTLLISGTSADTIDQSLTATGNITEPTVNGTSSSSIEFTATSIGTLLISGTSSDTVNFTATSTGTMLISGTSSDSIPVTASSDGTTTDPYYGIVTGTSNLEIAQSITSTGTLLIVGTSTRGIDAFSSSTGTVRITGTSSRTMTSSGTRIGKMILTGDSNSEISISGTASGEITDVVTGSSVSDMSISGTATGLISLFATILGTSTRFFTSSGTRSGKVTGDNSSLVVRFITKTVSNYTVNEDELPAGVPDNSVVQNDYATQYNMSSYIGLYENVLFYRRVSMLLDNNHAWVSVRDYGAIGDGVTNDTLAFQDAINAVVAGTNPYPGGNANRTLYIPSGHYKIGSSLLLTSRINVIGDGISSSIIEYTSLTGSLFQATADISYSSFEKMKWVGPGQGTGNSATGFSAHTNGANVLITFDKLFVEEFPKDAFYMPDTFNCSWDDCRIRRNGTVGTIANGNAEACSDSFGGGIRYDMITFVGAASTGNKISNCYITGNGRGVYVEGNERVLSHTFEDCKFEENYIGIDVDGRGSAIAKSRSVLLTASTYFEANVYAGALLGEGEAHSSYRNDTTTGTGLPGSWSLSGPDGIVFSGRYLENYESRFAVGNFTLGTQSTAFKIDKGDSTNNITYARFAQQGALAFGYSGLTSTSEVTINAGSGSPEGSITANTGSLYLRNNGSDMASTLYVKADGDATNTGWYQLGPIQGGTASRPAAVAANKGQRYYDTDILRTVVSNGAGTYREYNGLTSVTGTFANIPGHIAGASYYASNLNHILTSNGSKWISMGAPTTAFSATSGATTTVAARGSKLINTNTSTVATYTVVLPSGTNAVVGDRVEFVTAGEITSLTVSAGAATVRNALTTLAANSSFTYVYNDGTTTWYLV